MIELCRQYGIVVTAYGPLGRPGLSQDPVNDPTLLDDHQIKEIAAKYGRTVAQILLRYLVYEYNLRLLLFEKGKKNLKSLLTIVLIDSRLCEDCPSYQSRPTEPESSKICRRSISTLPPRTWPSSIA
jgi:hypothetical protein